MAPNDPKGHQILVLAGRVFYFQRNITLNAAPQTQQHVFNVSNAIVTHIQQKTNVFGVSIAVVTHVPLKMCHVFGV